jgi:hypothetical protein
VTSNCLQELRTAQRLSRIRLCTWGERSRPMMVAGAPASPTPRSLADPPWAPANSTPAFRRSRSPPQSCARLCNGRAGAQTLARPETSAMRRVSERLRVLGWRAWTLSDAGFSERGRRTLALRRRGGSVSLEEQSMGVALAALRVIRRALSLRPPPMGPLNRHRRARAPPRTTRTRLSHDPPTRRLSPIGRR